MSTGTEGRFQGCGAAVSLANEIIVYCDRGDHQNREYHEGPLGTEGRFRIRWNPIGHVNLADERLVPVPPGDTQ